MNETTTTEAERLAAIAGTILRQIGGAPRLSVMIGANYFVSLDGLGGVQFKFKGCRKANCIVIRLNALDTYDVSFWKLPRDIMKHREVKKIEGVYADQLKSIIESETGLFLSL